MGCIPVQCFGSVILIHSQTYTADIHRGTHTCRHTQKHWQNPSAAGSQVGTIPPSPTSFQDRQNQTQDIPTVTGIHAGALETRMLLPDHAPVTHTSAQELPAVDSAGHRNPSNSAGASMIIALVANKDSATASLWSDTGRRKDEGKRTLLTRKVLAPLSS